MRKVTGCYDGTAVQLLEPAPKTKQKVMVTLIDDEEIFDDLPVGVLLQYISPEKRFSEKGVFGRAMVKKHGNS